MKNKILKELNNLEICNMTRAEAELHAIRTTIEAYQMILKNNNELSENDKNKIRKKINDLGEIRDKKLSEIYNYGL
jgi:acyl-[acyl carrier protein]--UDP-N-acetylglucosamine O-acyltransferase